MSDTTEINVLFDGQEVQLLHVPGRSDFSLVTFDIMHARANSRSGFAVKLALKRGLECFAVVPRRPNWYPAAEVLRCADIIRAKKTRPTLGYGASMGAYGVLKYGAVTGMDAALAMSPQVTIDPDIIGDDDPRYGRYYDPALHADMRVTAADLAPIAFAVCDPHFRPDAAQRDLLGATVRVVDVPYMGHHSSKAMTPSDNAMSRFADALAGNTKALSTGLQAASLSSLQYALGRSAYDLSHDNSEAAYQMLTTAKATYGSDQALAVLLARACLATGRPAEAIADMQDQVDRVPDQVIYRRLLAELHDANGDATQAIHHMSHAVDTSHNAMLGRSLYRMMCAAKHPDTASFAHIARQRWPDLARLFGA